MGRKAIAVILAAEILVLSGCAAIIEGDYSSSTPHESGSSSNFQTAEASVEVEDGAELNDALIYFVENHIEYGNIKFAYDGDIDSDLAAACIDVSTNTPLGSYAVYYMTYNLNKIVSYYEADVTIAYRRNDEEITSVDDPADEQAVKDALYEVMSGHQIEYVFYSPDQRITADKITETAEDLYYEYPADITYMPNIQISSYPEGTYPCIYEIQFTYPYSQSLTESRSESISSSISDLIKKTKSIETDEPVEAIAEVLYDHIEIDYERETQNDYSRWYNIYTAYGALVMQKATSEGLAMAMKMMCDEAGIECYVVRGRLNNISHSWNIVRLQNGKLYHVDCTRIVKEEETGEEDEETEEKFQVSFYNDDEMSENYWWDNLKYPVCDGPSMIAADEEQNMVSEDTHLNSVYPLNPSYEGEEPEKDEGKEEKTEDVQNSGETQENEPEEPQQQDENEKDENTDTDEEEPENNRGSMDQEEKAEV